MSLKLQPAIWISTKPRPSISTWIEEGPRNSQHQAASLQYRKASITKTHTRKPASNTHNFQDKATLRLQHNVVLSDRCSPSPHFTTI